MSTFKRLVLPFGWTWPGGIRDIYPWVFNFASACLVVGIALILLRSVFLRSRPPAETAEHSSDA